MKPEIASHLLGKKDLAAETVIFAWAPIDGLLRWLAKHPGFVVADNAPGHHARHSVMVRAV